MSYVHIEAANSPPRSLSITLSALCSLLGACLPTLALYLLLFQPSVLVAELRLPAFSPAPAGFALTVPEHLALIVLGFAPIACVTYALLRARRCFESFRRGAYFTLEVVRSLRHFAGAVAFAAITGSLVRPLLTLLLVHAAEPRPGLAAFGGESCYLLLLLFAGIVWQVAGVMTKAVTLAEENSQFV